MPVFETYKAKIIRFYRQRRRMPSYGEIMRLVGFKSKSPAFKLVQKLVAAGVVAKDGAVGSYLKTSAKRFEWSDT